MLVVSTVAQSLALQTPDAWPVAKGLGYELHFAAARDDWASDLETLGHFQHLPASRSLKARSLFQLAGRLRTLSKQPWDLVQVQTPIVSAIWRIVASKEARRRTIYVAHGFHFYRGGPQLSGGFFRIVELCLASRVGAVATVCDEDEDWTRRLPNWLAPPIIWRLPGAGVRLDRFRKATAQSASGPYALFVGELNANKDPLLAIGAVEIARVSDPDLELVIIGAGPLEPAVMRARQTRPWVKHIRVCRDVERWMAGAQVLLAPSRREGLPRVIIEALSVGLPVVARKNRGSVELLQGNLGMLLNGTAGPRDWGAAIARVRDRSPDANAMKERAAQYDSPAFARSYRTLVRKMESA